MKVLALSVLLILSGCATVPPSDQPEAENGSGGLLLLGGIAVGVAVALALSGGDDNDPPEDERCSTVIGGGTQDRSCQ